MQIISKNRANFSIQPLNIDDCCLCWYLLGMRNSILNRKFRYTFSNATAVILFINIVVFMLTQFVFPKLLYYLAMVPSMVLYRKCYWQFLTYMFVHGSTMHLISNMFGLIIFGTALERKIGTREFVLFYLLTGTLSGIASYAAYYAAGMNVVLLGASGALYAIMLAFSVFFPNSVVFLFGIMPIRTPVLIVAYFLIEFFSQFISDGVAHTTHLFGLLFALLYVLIRFRINPLRAWSR